MDGPAFSVSSTTLTRGSSQTTLEYLIQKSSKPTDTQASRYACTAIGALMLIDTMIFNMPDAAAHTEHRPLMPMPTVAVNDILMLMVRLLNGSNLLSIGKLFLSVFQVTCKTSTPTPAATLKLMFTYTGTGPIVTCLV